MSDEPQQPDLPEGHIVPPGTPDNLAPTVWQPGQSGNPGGRPKGKSFTALCHEILAEHPIDPRTGKPMTATTLELLARSVVKAAISGPVGLRGVALAHLLGRVDPIRKDELAGIDAASVQILIVQEPEPRYVEARTTGGNGRGNGREESAGEPDQAAEDDAGGGGDRQ